MKVLHILTGACLWVVLLAQDPTTEPAKKNVVKKKDRPQYHISAGIGWLDVPNGFVFFKKQYHIFYQFRAQQGTFRPASWGHVISDNLVDWTLYPAALEPREFYDHNGCLSGSAVVHNSYLCLLYTGQLTTNNNTYQSQNVAISADGLVFQKYLRNPIIRESPFGSTTFGYPKVWRHMNAWYMLASTTKGMTAYLLLYTSPDLFLWKYNRTVAQSYGDMGYLWESPDFFAFNNYHVLFLSARGIQTDGYRFKNLYQSGYVVGNFNYISGEFEYLEVSTATFTELDHGHDFYAAKTMLAPDGRRLLIAWLGMWDSENGDFDNSWSSSLTIIREVVVTRQGTILMTPVKEITELRSEILEDAWYNPGEAFATGTRSFELLVNSSGVLYDAGLTLEWDGEPQYVILYSVDSGSVSVDRGGVDGLRRADWKPKSHVHFRIFVDYSSVEVFCGSGEIVFSSRIQSKRSMRVRIGGESQLHVIQYRLRRSITNDMKLRHKLNTEDKET